MAKRSRAPSPRQSADVKPRSAAGPKARRKVPTQRTYTPELLANGRVRYERTNEPVATIAADFKIHPGSLRRLATRLGWLRYNMAPRALAPAVRLMTEAQGLEALCAPPVAAAAPAAAEKTAGFDASVITRLERQVMEELATVEAMRAQLKGLPRRPRDAETTARTLTALTDTLQKLQRLRCAVPTAGQDHDDLPADLDEFRHELARRIDAFVASRTEPRHAARDAAASVDKAG